METFTRLFGSLLLFVYHCFDRVVISGYLSGLSRPFRWMESQANRSPEPNSLLTGKNTGKFANSALKF